MARPLAFERRAALERAMQVFWSKGYAETSVSDLTEAMGISKSSLYGAFGDKRAIFLESIKYYCDNVTNRVRTAIEVPGPARQVIRSVLGRAVDRILEPDGRRGCFLNNSSVEVASKDSEVAAQCKSGLQLMEETFECLVRRGQKEGDISIEKDPKMLARFLIGTINGIMVIGKANPDREGLNDIVEISMRAVS